MTFAASHGLGHDMEPISPRRDGIECDLGWLEPAEVGLLDLVARLLLAARRGDCRLRIVHPPDELEEVLALSGLDRLPHLRVEMVRESEQREQALGVQEEGDPADPIA
jgi:hypothetical protein